MFLNREMREEASEKQGGVGGVGGLWLWQPGKRVLDTTQVT